MKTIDQFIKELQRISEDKRKLPLVIDFPTDIETGSTRINFIETDPTIKMRWDDPLEMLRTPPDKMVITWHD